MQIKHKNVLVLGMGRSGIGAALLLHKSGNRVFVSELSATPDPAACDVLKNKGIAFETGGHSDRIFDSELAVLSPGIPHTAKIVSRLHEHTIPVISELELGYRFCSFPLIAITGSNGKTTVTSLIGKILSDNNMKPLVAGNIGISFCETLAAAGPDQYTYGVIEVSSFQLDTIKHFKPFISVITNLSPDHLDRYDSLEEYYASKIKIFVNQDDQDFAVLNGGDVRLIQLTGSIRPQKTYFNDHNVIFTDNQAIYESTPEGPLKLIDCSQLAIFGRHNYENIMAAFLAARLTGISDTGIIQSIKDFNGVEHRLEYVTTINSVAFYNDSKATNIESLSKSLCAFEEQVILIAGGRDKNSDYSLIRDVVRKKVKKLYLIGEASTKMARQLAHNDYRQADSLDQAVQQAFNDAGSLDTILLSPACASFDMFKNFEDRGRQFKEIVMSLHNVY